MNININIRGIKAVQGLIDRGARKVKKLSMDLPVKTAIAHKENVRTEITKMPHYSSPNHNTPPLLSNLRGPELKSGNTARVWMAQTGQYDLPNIIEEGANAHFQPNHWWFKNHEHPGMKGKHYWRNATIRTFEQIDKIIDAETKDLLK